MPRNEQKCRVDLHDVAHRPWPLCDGRHAIEMSWKNLLFAHWPVPVETLQPLLPTGLTLDTFDGTAWIGVVPFVMSDVRIWPLGGVPGAVNFPELNVRTYVTRQDKPGVYFFSLDAASLLTVAGARAWYGLPYHWARMAIRRENGWWHYTSSRRGTSEARFTARYRPTGPASCGTWGALAHWFTERYCLYSVGIFGGLYRGEIHHAMWPLCAAEAEFETNTMTAPLNLELGPAAPVLHYAERLDVVAWRPQRVGADAGR